MRKALFLLLLTLLATLAGAQNLPLTDLGLGHFSGDTGIYASGDTLALVYNNKPSNDPATSGTIVFRKSTDGGQNWTSVNVAPSQNCLTQPTLNYSAEEIIITYASGTNCLLARSIDGGATWSAWPSDPELLIGRTFENSPYVERRNNGLRWVSLDLPYPEYAQDAFCKPEDSEQLYAPHRFTDNEISMNGTPVFFGGVDDVDGVVRCNSDLHVKQVAGWPVFHKPVITSGQVVSLNGTYPADELFLGGLIENAPPLKIGGSPRQYSEWVGPAAYDPDRIVMVDVLGATYTAWLGQLTEPETLQLPVYATYPPADTDQPLYYNTFTVRDTIWTPLPDGTCANSTKFVNSKLWIKGTFSGRQTWAAADTICLIGKILLTNTTEGEAPTNNSSDFVDLISEKSILLKYGYRSPVDSLRYHPFCGSETQPLSIYANLFALGPHGSDPRSSGIFTFEYQHPHPSVPAYNYNGTVYDNIDLHRYRYPQEDGFPWATTVSGGAQNLKIDLPWYNPLWPESKPWLERGTIGIWGSVNQMRRGYLHRSYYDSDWPSNNVWDPHNDFCGGSSSPTSVGHYDPVLGISLTNENYPGTTGSGVGYKRNYADDSRNSLYSSRFYPDLPHDHSSVWQTGLAVYALEDSVPELLYLKNQLKRTRAKGFARRGGRALYSVNDLLVASQGQTFTDWSEHTAEGGNICSLDLEDDGSALIAQYRLEGQQPMLRIRKLTSGTGNIAWEQDEQVSNLLCDTVVLPNGQELLAKYDSSGYLRLWLLNPQGDDQLVESWQLAPFSPAVYDLASSRFYLKALDNSSLDIIFLLADTSEGDYSPGTIFHARASFTVPASDPAVPPLPEARLSAWPNPASGPMNIKVQFSSPQTHRVEIYNLRGQRIRTLESPVSKAGGEYEYTWDGLDKSGLSVGGGVFFLRASAGCNSLITKRICLIR